MQETAAASQQWFYEDKGERKGPVDEQVVVALIQSGVLTYGNEVWRQGLADWIRLESSDFRVHLEQKSPPPVTGARINNTLVWFLAFAPLIGYFLEAVVAGIVSGGNEYRISRDMAEARYWYVTVLLNLGLSWLDQQRLEKAGHDTSRFKGWVWLVPVYLYQRASVLQQGKAYFIVWLVLFVLLLGV